MNPTVTDIRTSLRVIKREEVRSSNGGGWNKSKIRHKKNCTSAPCSWWPTFYNKIILLASTTLFSYCPLSFFLFDNFFYSLGFNNFRKKSIFPGASGRRWEKSARKKCLADLNHQPVTWLGVLELAGRGACGVRVARLFLDRVTSLSERPYCRAGCPACTARVSCFSHHRSTCHEPPLFLTTYLPSNHPPSREPLSPKSSFYHPPSTPSQLYSSRRPCSGRKLTPKNENSLAFNRAKQQDKYWTG